MKNLTRKVIAFVSVLVGVSLPHSVFAGAYSVTSNADTDQNNVGTLRWAIHQANQDTDTDIRIDFSLPGGSETITLNSNLLPIQIATDVARTFTMDGLNTPGLVIDGNGNSIFFVDTGENVEISRMTLQNGASTGGTGGVGGSDTEGGGGGGGGLGAGGALFVNTAATVTVTDIQFDTNIAVGGDGGATNAIGSRWTSGGGGGMLNGNGGTVTSGITLQGGGGGGGLGANGADSSGNTGQNGLLLQSVQGGGAGGAGGSTAGGAGGSFGGGGGSGGLGDGGSSAEGGAGGGGGKGGQPGDDFNTSPPNGGFGADFGGGGGGSADFNNLFAGNGGNGGFGGGGGGGGASGSGGFGGGTGGASGTQGNGGSGYGGALFVRDGGQLTVKTLNIATQFQNNAVTAGSGTFNGNASGSDLYVHTNTTGVFDVATTANSQTLSGTIAGAGGIQKTGAGELILQGVNTYTGATTVTQGTLTLEMVGGLPAASAVTNNSTVKFSVAAGGTYSGNISGTGRLVKEGGGTLTLDGTNTFTGGVLISSGTLSLNKNLNAALPTTSAVEVNGQLNLLGSYNYQLADITGSGVIDLGGSQFTLGTTTSTTYSGTITTASTGSLVKTGSGTFEMTGNGASSISSGGLQIEEGKFVIGGSGSFTIAVGGDVTFTGDNTTLEMGGGSLVLSSQSIIGTGQNNTTLEVTGNFTAANMSITNVDNILNTGGAFTINGGVNVTGFSNFTVSGSGNTVINQDLTIDATKAITIDGNSASFDMNGGELTNNGTLNVQNGATLLTSGAQTLQNNNLLNLTGASITAPIDGSAGADSALVVNGTVTTGANITDVHYISVDSGTFTIQNDITGFTAGGTLGNIGFSIADGAIVVLDGVDLDMSGSVVDVSGTLTMDPAQSITGDGNSDLDLRSAFTATGNITNLGDINVRNSGVMTVDISPTNFDRITIDNGGIMVLNTALTINKVGGSLTNSGVLNLQDNNIVGALNSTLTLQSDFETGNGLITGVHNIVVNDANATFTIDTAPVGFTTFTNTAGTVLLNTDFPVVGNLSNAGTFSMNGHNLVVSDGVSLTNTGTWSTNGTITEAANGYDITIGNGGVFTVNNTVSGYTGFTVNNGGQVVMNTGGQLANVVLNANGTLNYSAGDITGNITGAGIVNVNGSFVPQGTINATEVNVNNGGTLTLNTPINGALTNSGTLVHTTLGNADVNGNFTQEAGGLLQLAISDSTPGNTSTLYVFAQTTLNGGAVEITLPDGGQSISDGEVFVLVDSANLAANPVLPTVSVPSQLFFGFTPSINGNNLVVTAERKTFSLVNTNPVLAGVAGALDEISTLGQTDTSLLSKFPVIGIIGAQPALQNIESIYNQLIPDEVNGGILESSFLTQNLVVEKLIGRLDQVRYGFNEHRSGYVAGDDIIEGQSSYGPMIFGNLSRQNGRGGLSGYESNTAGFGVFRDAPVTDYFRLGVAVSYAMTRVQRLDFTLNVTNIQNVQGMVYGSLDYRNLFINGVVSMGYNYYRGRRNIEAINQVAMSRYTSTQYGTKIEGGFSIPILNVEVSPTASIQFAHVNRATYQETGAPGANLEVTSQGSSMTELGLGGKIVNVSEPDDFLPEFHVFYLQDLQNSDLRVTSRFVDGGSMFTSQAPKLPKRGINMGLKVSAFISESALLEMGYDLYLRKGFTSQSANLKFRWLF